MIRDDVIRLSDGRAVAFAEFGDAQGVPVLFCHGTPMSRLFCPDEDATTAAGVRLIVPDRPGFGGSDLKPGRTVVDWVDDVVEFTVMLDIKQFSVVGLSSGGKYAAACAARLPLRVSTAALVSAVGPVRNVPGAYDGLNPRLREIVEVARQDPDRAATLAVEHVAKRVRAITENPYTVIHDYPSEVDRRWLITHPGRAMFEGSVREALRQGPTGWAWELVAQYRPWGFRTEEISVAVSLWHGDLDPIVPRSHAEWWIRTLPACGAHFWPDEGHAGIVRHWAEILAVVRGSE